MIGSLVILLTIAIQALVLNQAAHWIDRWALRLLPRRGDPARLALLMAGAVWVLFAMTLQVWLWALLLLKLGALHTLESAIYFALVVFTTVGFGDLILPPDWRLLSGMIGADGLLIFGWSTAFMVELVRRLRGGP
ncbi:MAG: two pore domain potassium channel family protein [Alphaproteobacteria bacterium]|nr:MAG: two pore domain potassium channel family protein [Alphaproteobacteria bacterium]